MSQPTHAQQLYQPTQPVQPQDTYYPPPYPYQQPRPVIVVHTQRKTSFIARVFWYLFIGWWLGGMWLLAGYFLCLTMLGIPVGLLMLNRLPQVMTLKPKGADVDVEVMADGSVRVKSGGPRQYNFFLRAVYFLFVGWWVSGFWIISAYLFIFTILGLPVGLMMLNILPTVMTLRRNRDEIDTDIHMPAQPQPLAPSRPYNGQGQEYADLTDEQINFRLTILIAAWALVPVAIAALFIFHR